MFLREYVYVDVDKVRGLAGQLYDGVPEKATNISARHKQAGLDFKILNAQTNTGNEDSIERSLADTLFKDLEADLESLGLLNDLSEALHAEEAWRNAESTVSPGHIIRITAPGTLFHPSQMSEALVGIATAAHGLADMGVSGEDEDSAPSAQRPKNANQHKRAERQASRPTNAAPQFPEDLLPSGEIVPMLGEGRKALAGMIKVVRGVFGEGVHLHLRPAGADGPVISARLEPGRKFLDTSPEILFSRYGLGEQEWTVVGIVGQIGTDSGALKSNDVTNADGSVNRAKLVDLVATFLGSTGGLIDLPQEPGFSLIPLAVYRAVGAGLEVAD